MNLGSLIPRPFFAGEEKTTCSRIPRKVGTPDVFEYFLFLDRSLPLYARICTTENQMMFTYSLSVRKRYPEKYTNLLVVYSLTI